MERTKRNTPLSEQVKRKVEAPVRTVQKELKGKFYGNNISTGSTLLDLAISGGRVRGGGLPTGILVEIFGPSGSGKTVLLSEIAGNIQARGGEVMFHDPEARLNKQFAKMFGLHLKKGDYTQPNTVTEVFKAVRKWQPEGVVNTIHGIMADSLAALSTNLEMDNEDGDKMGTRRAKEFSEELRKTCRLLPKNNYIMVCSNQIRQNMDAGPYGVKDVTPGGKAMEFYSSLRLKTKIIKKIEKKKMFHNKEVVRIIGVNIEVEVAKSSIWKPYRKAPVTIIFDYGIDDIRQNLQFIKDHTKGTMYHMDVESLGKSIEEAIQKVEENNWEERLRQEVILLWNEIEFHFVSQRKSKR